MQLNASNKITNFIISMLDSRTLEFYLLDILTFVQILSLHVNFVCILNHTTHYCYYFVPSVCLSTHPPSYHFIALHHPSFRSGCLESFSLCWLIFFSWLIWIEVYIFSWSFQSTSFLVSLILPTGFLGFDFIDFCLDFSFLLLTFGLNCFLFCNFLGYRLRFSFLGNFLL